MADSFPGVVTGANGDRRTPVHRVLAGVAGWVLLIWLIVLFVTSASIAALHLAAFLVVVVTVVALGSIGFAIWLVRPRVMQERVTIPAAIEGIDLSVDTLGRPLEPIPSVLEGEIVLRTVDGKRRYSIGGGG